MSRFELRLIDKSEGMTSFSSLAYLKREFKGEKVGHAGTLDKFASGLMLTMIGGATKLNPVFSSFDKRYIATIEFGSETDTLDPEGEVIATSGIPSYDEVEKSVYSFLGRQMQRPPIYSAIHVDGKRAYREARKGNDIEMPEREITIKDIRLISYDAGVAVVDAAVSKGTYIRSLARDIALKIGKRAHLIALRRTELGPLSLSDIDKSTNELLDMTGLLSHVRLDNKYRRLIDNGYIDRKAVLFDDDKSKKYCYLFFDDSIYGIGEKRDGSYKVISRV